MDLKAYIESGIIESVVLGFASSEEVADLQHNAELYPEIKSEWVAVSRSFEREATIHAVEAPAGLKEKIIAEIHTTKQEPAVEVKKQEAKIVSIRQETVTVGNPWKWTAAASIILVLGVGSLWITNLNEANKLKNELQTAQAQIESDKQEITILSVEQEKAMDLKKVLAQLNTKNISMAGTPMEPTADVHIMWNKDSKMAVMKSVSLKAIPTEMQLQLWAIADGKPVSLGVFDVAELEQMTDPFDVSANNISAFAITIEKRGGSQQPTMEKMVVMGAVAS